MMSASKGDIWLVDLDPTVGDEIRKTRPSIIMSSDRIGTLSLRVIVPLTSWQSSFTDVDWLVRIAPNRSNGLDKVSAADAFQVRSVSVKRLVRHLGRVNDRDIARIENAIKAVFEL